VIESEPCLNCGAVLTGPYCASCGQKTPHPDLTLREFLHDATAELTQLEGKVPKTLKALLLQPGRLTLDFLAGRRARWLPPLRLYLICSVAYFLSDAIVERITRRSERAVSEATVTRPDGSPTLTPEARRELEQSTVGRIFSREQIERAVANTAEFNRAVDSAYPKAMFVLVPLFALLTSVAWRRNLPRYPAHVYLALHLHAAWFGALALSIIVTAFFASERILIIMAVVALTYIVGYGLMTLRRVFKDSWVKTIAKAAVIAMVYAASLFLVSLGLLAYAMAMM
jgi:uncharacterized protein DUF3667